MSTFAYSWWLDPVREFPSQNVVPLWEFGLHPSDISKFSTFDLTGLFFENLASLELNSSCNYKWLTIVCLLAPSGALIAIPTYYWSSTHFFRSHRSSTLDFHFLSHYSYIKAIKLYKGNHWTRSAGFMDTLWVRLGITDDDLGTSWSLPGDNLGMTLGWLGHYFSKTWQDSCILWHTLEYSGIICHTLAYSCILWHTLAYSGILWHTLA